MSRRQQKQAENIGRHVMEEMRRPAARTEAQDDFDRFRFLQQLDAAPFEVTEWEAEFIESQLQAYAEQEGIKQIAFTPKQRDAIDQMRKEYAARLC